MNKGLNGTDVVLICFMFFVTLNAIKEHHEKTRELIIQQCEITKEIDQ